MLSWVYSGREWPKELAGAQLCGFASDLSRAFAGAHDAHCSWQSLPPAALAVRKLEGRMTPSLTLRQRLAGAVELTILRTANALPTRMLARVASVIGAIYWLVSPSVREIVLDNLALCFPELSNRERVAIGRASLGEATLGHLEKGKWWYGAALEQHCVIEGLEHVTAQTSRGRGVLLLGFHFSDLENAISILAERTPISAMYMRRPNPIVDAASRRLRCSRAHLIERGDVRKVLSTLREGRAIWFAPDQEYRDRHQVPAPFFGMTIPTLSSATRLVQMSGAAVVAFTHCRERDGCRIVLSPPLEGFGEDEAADAARINRILEDAIREHPSSYLWINRRLRSRRILADA